MVRAQVALAESAHTHTQVKGTVSRGSPAKESEQQSEGRLDEREGGNVQLEVRRRREPRAGFHIRLAAIAPRIITMASGNAVVAVDLVRRGLDAAVCSLVMSIVQSLRRRWTRRACWWWRR